jgi:cell division protein FtsB
MSGVKAKFRKINYKLKHDFLTVENVVLLLAIILCLVWAYQSIVAMSKNWKLAETLSEKNKQLELLTVEVETAELENEYYKTDEYQELAARKYLDKKMPGENMVVMPENSEAAKNKYKITEESSEEKVYSNFEKWMMYLFPS